VNNCVRLFVGVVDGRPTPTPEPRLAAPGLGVFREGDPRFEMVEPAEGEISPLNRVGLPAPEHMSYLSAAKRSRYLPLKDVAAVLIRGRAEGVTASSNARDVDEAGVTRPLEYGVYRAEFDGVMRPEE
jgi:hypothetical protein